MKTTHKVALITGALALWVLQLAGSAPAEPSPLDSPAPSNAGPFDQRDFPCQEDEVLGYAPQFGPDHVGCIHIDELRNRQASR